MALLNCPDCGRGISDKAAACPGCGCPAPAPSPGVGFGPPPPPDFRVPPPPPPAPAAPPREKIFKVVEPPRTLPIRWILGLVVVLAALYAVVRWEDVSRMASRRIDALMGKVERPAPERAETLPEE